MLEDNPNHMPEVKQLDLLGSPKRVNNKFVNLSRSDEKPIFNLKMRSKNVIHIKY